MYIRSKGSSIASEQKGKKDDKQRYEEIYKENDKQRSKEVYKEKYKEYDICYKPIDGNHLPYGHKKVPSYIAVLKSVM